MTELTLRRRAGQRTPVSSNAAQPPSDTELLARFVERRDEPAFEELVHRHGAMVMGVCRRVLNHPHDAEDAFQATFLVLAKKSAKIRRPELLGNWLYGVAYRSAQKVQSIKPKALPMSDVQTPAARPAEDAAEREIRSVMDEELHRLPERDRLVLTLSYLQGLTHAEIARRLGWRPGSVSRRLAHGRELLRARLSRRGVVLSLGALATLLDRLKASEAVGAELVASTVKASAALAAGCELETVVPLRVSTIVRSFRIANLPLLAAVLAALLLIGPCTVNFHLDRPPTRATAAGADEGLAIPANPAGNTHGTHGKTSDGGGDSDASLVAEQPPVDGGATPCLSCH